MASELNDDSLVPITMAEQYRAVDVLSRVNTLIEMGIYPVARWSLKASCYLHGWQARDVETTEQAPTQPRIDCWQCGRSLIVTVRVKEQ